MKLQRELTSNDSVIFSCPREEISCLVGNLFGEISTPCEESRMCDNIVICGYTHSGKYGVLHIGKDSCCFKGEKDDIEAVLDSVCLERRCERG